MNIGRLSVIMVLGFIALKTGLSENKSMLVTQDESYWQAINAVRNDLKTPHNLRKQTGTMQYTRPDLPYSFSSAEGHFLIHYTLEGDSAVDSTCTNTAGVPDWVYEAAQIAERSYRLLIDTLGFQVPPVDDEASPETDLYIIDVGYDYAYTYPEAPVTSTPDQTDDYTAYTEIDNDYIGYATSGLAALQVTIAHEYFHVVQLGYNWFTSNNLSGAVDGDTYFLEWCSTWMEERSYPEVNDYYNYVYSFFYSPARSIWFYNYSYALGFFIRFILDQYGDDLLIKVWEKIKTDYAFESLQSVLADEYAADLAGLWNEFIYRCYFTGERYDPDLSLSTDAQDFPLLQIANTEEYIGTTEFNSTIKPFANIPYCITFGQDLRCGINASTDYENYFSGRYLLVKKDFGQISKAVVLNENQFVGDISDGDSLLIFMTNFHMDDSYPLTLTVAAVDDSFKIATKILTVYPNPYLPGDYENLMIDLQLGSITKAIKTNWFDLRGRNAYHKNFVGPYGIGLQSISFSSADLSGARLASGVYVLRIEVGSKIFNRKVLLLK